MKKGLLIFLTTISLILPINVFANGENILPNYENILPAPISVERKNIDGTEYVIKMYELPIQTEDTTLIEPDFELDGFIFTHETTNKKINETTDTKEVTEQAQAQSQSKNLEEVIKQFPSTKAYDQDGYKGTLTLDTGSIVTEVAGYTTKNYTVSTTKEYPNLMYADPSYVSQSAVKDGYTLPLTDVSWTVMGTSLAGDTLVPTEYKAVATYSKTFSSQVPTGYISTARYKGNVTKTVADTADFTVTYVGTLIDEGMPTILKVITGFVLVLLIICATTLLLLYLKSRRGSYVYNLIDKEYICIGHQSINPKKPVIDLNDFEDMIQSNVFQFILDKKTTSELFGRNINVTYKDVTIKHLVNEKKGEYRFELNLGGVLDAE